MQALASKMFRRGMFGCYLLSLLWFGPNRWIFAKAELSQTLEQLVLWFLHNPFSRFTNKCLAIYKPNLKAEMPQARPHYPPLPTPPHPPPIPSLPPPPLGLYFPAHPWLNEKNKRQDSPFHFLLRSAGPCLPGAPRLCDWV